MKNLKDLKKHIIRNIDPKWTTLEKVRYVYLESGKNLQKHTEFYLTIDDKLSNGLNSRELDKVLLGRLKSEEWNKMLCKTGAEFIKEVLNYLGISSQLVETVGYTKIKGMKNHLHHYFLSVNVDGKNIFLTPAADYFNIQNGLCTLRFGSEISYLLNGEPFYKSNIGEIPHIVLSKEEIKELDDKIGYTTKVATQTRKGEVVETMYIDDIMKKDRDSYINILSLEAPFYNEIINELTKDGIKSISDKRNNWNNVINIICERVGKRISDISGKPYEFTEYVNRGNYNEWFKYMNNFFDKGSYKNTEVIYSNPNLILNKANKLCQLLISFCNKNVDSDDKETILSFRNSFNKNIMELSKHFIDPRFVIEPKNKDDYVSSTYINHKFKTMMPILFNTNSGLQDKFNTEGYSEQIEYFKKCIEYLFMELNKKNLLEEDDDIKIHPIFKRMNLYTYRNKENGNYGVYIGISDSNEEDGNPIFWYKYNLVDNILERTSLINITAESSKSGKYEIISNRLKNVINNIRDIEEAGNKPFVLTLQ